MGRRAVQLFERAERLGGVRAKVALAVKARIPSTEAAAAPDTPELLARLEAAFDLVLPRDASSPPTSGAFERPDAEALAQLASRPTVPSITVEEKLRGHLKLLRELLTQRTLVLENVQTASTRVTESASQTLRVARVSVWCLLDAGRGIRCVDLYEANTHRHSSGMELLREGFEPYFSALESEQAIAAHDARTDPRTACLWGPYLAHHGITSMLDVPIWRRDRMLGVVCHEHVGPPRTWSEDDETLAYLMAALVGTALDVANARQDSKAGWPTPE